MKKMDKLLFIAVIILMIFSLFMIYSASYIWSEYKFDNQFKYVINQGIFSIIGVICLLIISKIDGKSAAFGIVKSSLEGAIVTPDFMVYNIDTTKIVPEYLELVLTNEAILNQFSNSSSGTTGRRRLSQKIFENTLIALPPIDEQRELIAKILEIRKMQKSLEEQMQKNIEYFNNKIFS